MPGGAGFLPSTVGGGFKYDPYLWKILNLTCASFSTGWFNHFLDKSWLEITKHPFKKTVCPNFSLLTMVINHALTIENPCVP